MAYSVEMGRRRFHGLRGNLHMHTVHSDGTKTHRELGQIAAEAGLDYIVVTDHNVLVPDVEGWYGKTLVLVGEEVHDTERKPQSSHTLCFDIHQDAAGYAGDPQRLVDAVAAQGGFTFVAHPFERDAVPFLPEPNISWRDWQVTGYAGIELWNYMSEFKGALRSKAHAVLCAYFPALTASGPYPETLHKWDELLQTRPVAALGGSDAHGNTYRLGPLSRAVQPYDYLFRCVNTHLLSEEPLTGDVGHDRAVIYGRIAGRPWLYGVRAAGRDRRIYLLGQVGGWRGDDGRDAGDAGNGRVAGDLSPAGGAAPAARWASGGPHAGPATDPGHTPGGRLPG